MKIEQAIIGLIIKEKSDAFKYYLLHGIDASFFFDDPQSGVVYSYLVRYFRKYGKIPSKLFLKKKFPKYKLVFTSDDKVALLDELRRKFKSSELAGIVKVAAERIARGDDGVEDTILSRTIDLKNRVMVGQVMQSQNVQKQLSYYLERAIRGNKVNGLPFGVENFDKVTLGIQPNDFVAVLARQKTGKTNFVLWLISQWLRLEKRTLFIPLEGSVDLLEGRLVCFYAGLNYWRWRAGALMPDELDRYEKALKQIAKGKGQYLILPRQQRITPTGVLSLIEEHKPDATIIDAAHKMHDDEHTTHNYDRTTNVSRGLAEIVSNKNYPIVITWQVNRRAPRKPPQLHHASYTDALGQDVTIAFGLFRNSVMKNLNIMQVDMLANREDETPGLMLNWNLGDNMQVSEASEDFQTYYIEEGDDDEDD